MIGRVVQMDLWLWDSNVGHAYSCWLTGHAAFGVFENVKFALEQFPNLDWLGFRSELRSRVGMR